MLQTIESLKTRLEALLALPGRPITVSLLRSTEAEASRVVLVPQDSPVERDSVTTTEHDTIEIHCIAITPEEALRMMDAVVDDLMDLEPGGMVIRGATLTGCECVGQRSVSDQTDAEDTYDASTTWKFTIEKPRKKNH